MIALLDDRRTMTLLRQHMTHTDTPQEQSLITHSHLCDVILTTCMRDSPPSRTLQAPRSGGLREQEGRAHLHIDIEHGDLAEALRHVLICCLVVLFHLRLPYALCNLGLDLWIKGVCAEELHLGLALLCFRLPVRLYLPAEARMTVREPAAMARCLRTACESHLAHLGSLAPTTLPS